MNFHVYIILEKDYKKDASFADLINAKKYACLLYLNNNNVFIMDSDNDIIFQLNDLPF